MTCLNIARFIAHMQQLRKHDLCFTLSCTAVFAEVLAIKPEVLAIKPEVSNKTGSISNKTGSISNKTGSISNKTGRRPSPLLEAVLHPPLGHGSNGLRISDSTLFITLSAEPVILCSVKQVFI